MPSAPSALSQRLLESGGAGAISLADPPIGASPPNEGVVRRVSSTFSRQFSGTPSSIPVPGSRRSEDHHMISASPLPGRPFSYLRQKTKVLAQHASDNLEAESVPSTVSGETLTPSAYRGVRHMETAAPRTWHTGYDTLTSPYAAGGGLPDLDQLTSGAEGGGPEGGGAQGGRGDAPKKSKAEHQMHIILYGIINSIVGIPTMISFAAIIFQDKVYAPYLGQLAKMAFLASGMHQLVFTLFSTLPFAVGQVQDVGLIFLSSMASSIAAICVEKGYEDHEALGTALLTLALSTLLVGVLIMLVGHFKLATLVQYVPLPVVGGYLGYVGYFCLAAGVALACGVEVDTFPSWANLFAKEPAIKFVPTFAATAALYLTMNYVAHPLALPAVLVAIPLGFHAVLLATRTTLQEAADLGWVMQPEPGKNFWEIYKLFNIHDLKFDGVYFPAMLDQVPKLLALFFVVAFGSCLDVAAIQADSPEPLDYNHELKTVGLSNVVVGLSGAGLTGSYIFSQTIFSMRAGIDSRLHGAIVAGAEIALFLLPVSVVQYMPNFFFGSLLMLFGVEITLDWLFHSYHKVTRAEFALLWATYLAIMLTDLETGIGIGIVLATFFFAFSYARVSLKAFTVLPSRSGVVRSIAEREVLDLFNARVAALALSGYIFFGSSVSISDKVMKLANALVEADSTVDELEDREASAHGGVGGGGNKGIYSPAMLAHTRAAFKAAPRFLLLDFRNVGGLDATAAQSFGTLWNMVGRLGVELVVTHLDNAQTRDLLAAHGIEVVSPGAKDVASWACLAFGTLEQGMQYCEGQFLEVAYRFGLATPRPLVMTLNETLLAHCDGPDPLGTTIIGRPVDVDALGKKLLKHMTEVHFGPGQEIYKFGDRARSIYIIQEGSIFVESNVYRPKAETVVGVDDEPTALEVFDRRFEYGPGAIIGTSDFFLQSPRRFLATCGKAARVFALSRDAFNAMAIDAPDAALLLMTAIVRSEVLRRSNTYDDEDEAKPGGYRQ